MGLGPNGSSLLQRCEKQIALTEDWIAMEQTERGDARRKARIRHAMKHKAVKKPEAPVRPLKEKENGKRVWIWFGEDIPSKEMWNSGKRWITYTSEQIRAAGFKLPKLVKREKK